MSECAFPHLYVVIMAGGSGTRFWPMSRQSLPKQFLPLAGQKSLLRETFERVVPLSVPGHVWVASTAGYRDLVLREIPELDEECLLMEPVSRNTAPCIGLAAQCILQKDPEATLLVCPADHVIRPPAIFQASIRTALEWLEGREDEEDPLTMAFGIVPRYPATMFGYVARGKELFRRESSLGSTRIFKAERFKEKPGRDLAARCFESGNFYWNSGIYIWEAKGIQRLIEQHLPELANGLAAIMKRVSGGGNLAAALEERFGGLPSISIDHAVLEHAANVVLMEAEFGWDDLGSWLSVDRYGEKDGAGNSVLGRHVGVDTHDCILVGKKRLLATVGVENLIVVETEDAVLVCARDQAERVHEIVELLRAQGTTECV